MKTKIIKSTLIITIVSVFVKMLSFMQQLLLSNRFGATNTNDTYLASVSIITLFVSFFVSPFSSTYLPHATKYYYHDDEDSKRRFFGSIYSQALLIGATQTLLLIATIDKLVPIITPGFSEESQLLVKTLVFLQSPSLIAQMIIGVNNSNLQVVEKFSLPQLLLGVPYLFSVAYLILSTNPNTKILAIITTISYFVVLIIQSPILKPYIPIKVCLRMDPIDAKIMYMTMGSFFITSAVRQINSIVNQAFASLLPEGSITIMANANKIAITGTTLISVAISTVSYTYMAKNIYKDEADNNSELLNDSLILVNTIILPISIFFTVLSNSIAAILFGHGAFSDEAVKRTGICLAIYSVGMIGYGIQDVIIRSMFAYKISRYSVFSSTILALTNIFLNAVSYKTFGLYGLAGSATFSILIIIPYLLYKTHTKMIRIDFSKIIKNFFSSLLLSIISAIWVIIIKEVFFADTNLVFFFVSTLMFFSSYVIFGYFTGDDICRLVIKKIKSMIFRTGNTNGNI